MADKKKRNLEDVRSEIDSIDDTLAEMLNRRASLAQEIGDLKGRDGKPFFTPERERQIYEKLAKDNKGPLTTRQLIAVFREIISAARAAEQPLKCAFWGPEGTFSHMAAIEMFGSSADFLPEESINDVFLAIEHGKSDYGVVPVENSVAGVVPETLDMFPQTNVKICAEVYVPIHHHLASISTSMDLIDRVYAGPQPSQQCKRWLREHLPRAAIIETVPTAKAMHRAAEDPQGAAIGNKVGASITGLPILAEHIEDNAHNRTRFLVIGYNEPAKTGRDKTSIMFNLRNKPGELYQALGAFVEHGVNLLMIESRPASRASFEYIFYCDCLGHRLDDNVQAAIESLKQYALETTILGSYPTQDSDQS